MIARGAVEQAELVETLTYSGALDLVEGSWEPEFAPATASAIVGQFHKNFSHVPPICASFLLFCRVLRGALRGNLC